MSGHSKFANIKHKKEKNDAAKMGETESKLAITAAGFLGRQMEQ